MDYEFYVEMYGQGGHHLETYGTNCLDEARQKLVEFALLADVGDTFKLNDSGEW